MEGKQSTFTFTFKTLVISGAGVFATWFVGKLLDHFFKLSLLKEAQSWATGVWLWLLQETPMQNWVMVLIFFASLALGCVAFYFHRLTTEAYDDLE